MYQPSTPPSITPHSGRTALIYGVFAGLVLGVVESVIVVYLTRNMSYNPYGQLSIPFSLLFWVIVFLVVGALAGKRTGKIATGTLTGLWAGMVGGIITAVTLFAMLMSTSYGYNSVGMMAANLTYMIFLVLAALGIGTGLGALGGLIGQSFSTSAQTPFQRYQQQSDPPQPYQTPYRQSDPPQQEQEQVQYQQNSSPRQEQQD